jgi:hypothetical protein
VIGNMTKTNGTYPRSICGARLFTTFLALLTCAIFETRIAAAPIGYAVDADRGLYEIELAADGEIKYIGNTGEFLEAIAVSPTGELFATDVRGLLYKVNLGSGSAILIGDTGRGNIEGLDFSGNVLLGTDFNEQPSIFSIDTSNATTTDVTLSSRTLGVVRTMATLDADRMLVSTNLPLPNTLYSIELNTGAISRKGNMGSDAGQVSGLDFAVDGKLYGVSDAGHILHVNPADATKTVLSSSGNLWLGFTTVPEPSTFALVAIVGLVGAAVLLRSKPFALRREGLAANQRLERI